MHGFTDNYIKVKTPFNSLLINQLRQVSLKELDPDGSVLAEYLPDLISDIVLN